MMAGDEQGQGARGKERAAAARAAWPARVSLVTRRQLDHLMCKEPTRPLWPAGRPFLAA